MDRAHSTETETMQITTFSIETAQQIADNLNRMNDRRGDAATFYDVVRASDVSDEIPWGDFGELCCVRVGNAQSQFIGYI